MKNNYSGQFGTFGNAAMEYARELENINGKLIEQLTQKNVELFNSAIEMNHQFTSLLSTTKDVQAFLTEQVRLTNEYNNSVIGTMQLAADIITRSQNDYRLWFEASAKSVADAGQAFTTADTTPEKKAA